MGSLGWCKCYWCPRWVHDPYLLDGFPFPLCDRCFDWILTGGGPYEPCARTRAAYRVELWFPKLDFLTCTAIAWYLEPWGKP